MTRIIKQLETKEATTVNTTTEWLLGSKDTSFSLKNVDLVASPALSASPPVSCSVETATDKGHESDPKVNLVGAEVYSKKNEDEQPVPVKLRTLRQSSLNSGHGLL